MKRRVIIGALTLLVVGCVVFVACGAQEHRVQTSLDAAVNEDLSSTLAFAVSSASSDLTTSVTGTVFVYGSRQGVSHAQIAATFKVDPNDWAGVEFFFPQGVTVTKVECSYPQETSSSYATGSDHSSASVWWSPSVGSRVDIARSLTKVPSGGGSGTALIDVDIDEAVFDSHKAVFTVGVGEGEKGIYPDYVRFDVVFGDE